jgi:cold-inducible RNA-binding protein
MCHDPCCTQLSGANEMSRIFVGNIPISCTEVDLKNWFETHGHEVSQVEIIRDRVTGQSRGFAFIELRYGWKAQSAIESLHQRELQGRKLTVDAATPMGSNRKAEEQLRP